MIPPKLVTVITDATVETEVTDRWAEPHGCLQTVTDMPAPGFMRLILLGSSGLQIRHHENWVVIPTEVLLTLAEQADPALKPPTAKQLQKANEQNGKLIPNG